MKIKIKKNKNKSSLFEIDRLEELFGYNLPDDYKDFLIQYNGGEPEINIFSIPEKQNESGVTKFFCQRDIIKEKKILGNRLADGVVPIAEAECGNIVCLALAGAKKGIYFWDHEFEDEEENLPSWRNMFYLAKSFEEFMNSLKKFDPSKVELKPGAEIVWADPEFLKKIQKEQRQG